MKLSYDEIKKVTFGAIDIIDKEDGIYFRKCTQRQIDAWYEIRKDLGERSETTTGVTIDFHTDSSYVEFDVIGQKFEVLIDEILTKQILGEQIVCVELPKGEHRVTLVFPSHDVGILKSISINEGATIGYF